MQHRLAIAAALACACALEACGPSGRAEPEAGARAAKLYTAMACHQCHGADGAGTPMAPPLTELERHWDRAELAAYLADPRAFLETDERLAELERRYAAEMPAASLSEADRLALADHVLALGAP